MRNIYRSRVALRVVTLTVAFSLWGAHAEAVQLAPNWPALEKQLTDDKVVAGSALEKLIRDNQDFSLLDRREANDTLGLPPWLRVYWRNGHPDWRYSPEDPTGGYPRALGNIYRWMLLNPDLKPAPDEPPIPPKIREPANINEISATPSNLRISGAQTSPRSESDIRVNYLDPTKIIAASNTVAPGGRQAEFFSTDGGANWGQTSLPLTGLDLAHSNPTVDWTSDGRAWSTTLGIQNGGHLQGRAYVSTNNGSTWTYDDTFSGTQVEVDKEQMWIDHSAASGFRNNIYVIYHNGFAAFMNRRTTAGWQTPIQVSGAESTGTAVGGDVKTNSAGDVFGFWPTTGNGAGNGKIFVVKSTNGGVSYGALGTTPVQIASTFATYNIGVPAFSSRRMLIYTTAGAYKTATRNNVYVAWADLSGEAGCTVPINEPGTNIGSACKTRIWFSRSTDGGATWSPKTTIYNQAGLNDQFNPSLVVDESNGGIGIIYYDTVMDPGRKKVDVWYQSSSNHGVSWNAPIKVTTAQTDETSAGADSGNQFGDYNGFSGNNGTFFASWTDRRGGATNKEEIWTANITDSFAMAQRTVTINQAIGQPDPTIASQINFTVVFWENVTGFSAAGLTVSGTVPFKTPKITVSGGGAIYNVAVSGMTGLGTVNVTVLAGAATGVTSGLSNLASTSTDNVVTFQPAISITNAAISEGNSGMKNLPFQVTLSTASTTDITVNYQTADGTAMSASGITNSEFISIPAVGTADPYPSTITVPAGIGLLTKVRVKMNRLTHTFLRDIDVLLVGPGGQSVVLMSDIGGGTTAAGITLTFDDTGPALGAGLVLSGTYKPTNIEDTEGSDTFPSPAPAGPYGTGLSVFNGTDPAGVWKLFLIDDTSPDSGNLAGGWTLELTPGQQQDYVATSGTLTFTAGTTSQDIIIPVVGDSTVESTETFVVNLSNAVNADIAVGQATGTIHNDDGNGTAPAITVQPAGKAIASGETVALSVTATGTTPLTYQWYSGPSGTTTNPIPVATESSFTTPPLTANAVYWVRVTNGYGDANSLTVTITVASRRRGQVTSF